MTARTWVLALWGLGFSLLGSAAEVDWGTRRVGFEETWPGVGAGWGWEKLMPGIGMRRAGSGGFCALGEFERGWMADGDEGYGVAALLQGEFDIESRLEVSRFGRSGNEIQLYIVHHPTGGLLPELAKAFIRRKLGIAEDSKSLVSIDQARAAHLDRRKVFFYGMFPEDLPSGDYRVVVELRDENHKAIQHYERRMAHRRWEKNPLAKLNDAELLREYLKRGKALKGSHIEPIDSPISKDQLAISYMSPPSRAWQATHYEIIRRRAAMVPDLIKLLETEAVRNPGEFTMWNAPFGLAVDVMRMLRAIGDPRPVPLLVQVIDGMNGKVNLQVRRQALEAVEDLTHIAFCVDRDNSMPQLAMMGDGALCVSILEVNPDWKPRFTTLAGMYKRWLGGEGRDPNRWLSLAHERALRALEGKDPLAIRSALEFLPHISFLAQGNEKTDEIAASAARIAALNRRPEFREMTGAGYSVRLSNVLAMHGPAARPYVSIIIDEIERHPSSYTCGLLARVGGGKAMAYMVKSLPHLRKRAIEFGIGLKSSVFDVNNNATQAVLSYQGCRFGIEQLAGRTFAEDRDIDEWWATASGRGQEDWMTKNLDRTAAEADAGSAKAQAILRRMLPDLPHAEDDDPFDPPGQRGSNEDYRENRPGAYRLKWLKDNRARLEYDELRSQFRCRETRKSS